MKKIMALCIAIPLCLGLAACAGNNEAAESDSSPQVSEESRRELNANKDKTLVNKSTESATTSGVIVRTDNENLVEVRIENGEATVTLNADRFDELYDYSKRYEGKIYTGTIKIAETSGKVKDACIAQIPELDYMNGTDFVIPTIFLLMENGTVESTLVDFYPHEFQTAEFLSRQLLWMEDIVSLSYENDGEGIGAMTVYAEDKSGIRYDLRIPASFCELYSGSWVCDFYNIEGHYMSGYYGVLTFFEDGTVVFEKSWMEEGNPARYTGTFDLVIAENTGRRPGMMDFDLYLDSSSNINGKPKEIHGTYFAEVSNLIGLNLWYGDEDHLHWDGKVLMMELEFMLGYNPFGGNYDYSDYVISTLFEVREKVEVYGMTLLDTGEYVNINGWDCRLINLGTNHADQFVTEIHYAISDDGVIYEYDVLNDEWIVLWVPD